jgi:lysine 2,3-aminomutase
MEDNKMNKKSQFHAKIFFDEHPVIYNILRKSVSVESARYNLFDFLNKVDLKIRVANSRFHPLEIIVIKEAIDILKNIFSKRGERITHSSAVKILYQSSKGKKTAVSEAFFEEFRHLFRATAGKDKIYPNAMKSPHNIIQGREAALRRSARLDVLAENADRCIARYPSGMDTDIAARRERNKRRIMEALGAAESEWTDYNWHFDNVVKGSHAIEKLVKISAQEKKAVQIAEKGRVPFGITPYYLSLFDNEEPRYDYAVRAQVLPNEGYLRFMASSRDRKEFDYMRETDTSPFDLITRRYPKICILKPYNACPQVCTYCQRNWEIEEVLAPGALAPEKKIRAAIEWIKSTPSINEVLITGGEPLVISDENLERIIAGLADIEHIINIRIGTRMLVTVPFRFTEKLGEILSKYNVPSRRRISIVTHFEHVYEITPEAVRAIASLRRMGLSVYNQTVFTLYNSRRFEVAALRRLLRICGVDPYYTFNTKGKEEMNALRVPIARLLQEQKEESRLFPGLTRTDEAMFNLPRLGKNYLRAYQHHSLIMVMPDGSRVYEFHPWEKKITLADTYVSKDVPILDYLKSLKEMGENTDEYKTIWYYY